MPHMRLVGFAKSGVGGGAAVNALRFTFQPSPGDVDEMSGGYY
jgi:hypothetical protein